MRSCSRSARRFVAIPGRPWRSSLYRRGPWRSSRTMSRIQRSPTMSRPRAKLQYCRYERTRARYHLTISSVNLIISSAQISAREIDMAADPRDLVTSYIQAVGERRLESLPPLLEPDAEFTLGDNTARGREAFVGAFRRLLPIIERNDIRHLFVDGD